MTRLKTKINSFEDLKLLAENINLSLKREAKKILVCAGTGCIASGSLEVYEKLKKLVAEKGLLISVDLLHEKESHKSSSNDCSCTSNSNKDCNCNDNFDGVSVKKSGCHGFCEVGPLVRIEPCNYLYLHVKPEDCEEIIETTLLKGLPIERLMYKSEGKIYPVQEKIPFYERQTRTVLGNCGHIEAESIEEYIAHRGYEALGKAINELKSKDVCDIINESGLRGRGGGGYPAGRKWIQVLAEESEIKYVVCNGDEGDPGAFMDRSIMEGDPHKVIEGMLIAGYASKCTEGYIYVRAEYPMAVKRLKIAIEQARNYGLLGENIMDSGFNFDIHLVQGAGAFVCGEGSALTASIEGERGMPRTKPPRTVKEGLWRKPTLLNNVETFANVPHIILHGSEWFKKLGPSKSPGTKAFALTGNVNNTGLIEVPMGTTLREVIFDIGGGIKGNNKFKAVQIGGPSGGCLTEEHLDIPLDFDSLANVGAMIGSGGLVVMDDSTCMVEVARFFMNFTQNESCGKCIPCREGTKRMLQILEKIVSGEGTIDDLDLLESLGDTISKTSLCGLGKSAANPVVSTLKYFRDEYLSHVVDKKCPTGTCSKLRNFYILEDKCIGCSKCSRICPAKAISGKIKEPFVIDNKKCLKCGACIESCSFGAIVTR